MYERIIQICLIGAVVIVVAGILAGCDSDNTSIDKSDLRGEIRTELDALVHGMEFHCVVIGTGMLCVPHEEEPRTLEP